MNEMEEQVISISEIFEALKKRWLMILTITLSITLIIGIMSFISSKPTYESRVKIFAGKTEQIQSDYSSQDLETYSNLMNTYIGLIKTDDFMNKIISKTGINSSPKELMNTLQFITNDSTPILEIKYISSNPKIAEKVVSAVTEEFEVTIKEIVLNTYTKVIDSVKIEQVKTEKVKKIALGFLIGLILSCGLSFIFEYFDNTFKSKENLERELGIPVLGVIPLVNEEWEENRCL